MRSLPTHIRLSKWYMDVVDAAGSGAIVYHASMEWGGVRLVQGEVLCFMPSGSGGGSRSTLRPGAEPLLTIAGGVARLHCSMAGLGLHGTWAGSAPGVDVRLFESAAGYIDWHCAIPCGKAELAIGESRIQGLGYAERLEMTLPPSRLPMAEIRWGRFLSTEARATWIHWEGGSPRTWIVDERGTHETGHVDDTLVATDAWRLDLKGERRVIRDAKVGSLLKGPASLLRPLVGRRVRGMHETKWLTHAERRPTQALDAGMELCSGWALHEVVTLPETVRREVTR